SIDTRFDGVTTFNHFHRSFKFTLKSAKSSVVDFRGDKNLGMTDSASHHQPLLCCSCLIRLAAALGGNNIFNSSEVAIRGFSFSSPGLGGRFGIPLAIFCCWLLFISFMAATAVK